VARIASSLDNEAQALVEMSDSLWGSTEALDMLNPRASSSTRTRWFRHLCTGKEQKAAFEDIRRAGGAYQQAWEAIGRGEKPDIVTKLRRIAERVSLAAARATKSCAAGQQKIAAPPWTPAQVTRVIGARETGFAYGDRVEYRGQTWIVREHRGDLADVVSPSEPRVAGDRTDAARLAARRASPRPCRQRGPRAPGSRSKPRWISRRTRP
jgi:hypothetical protein